MSGRSAFLRRPPRRWTVRPRPSAALPAAGPSPSPRFEATVGQGRSFSSQVIPQDFLAVDHARRRLLPRAHQAQGHGSVVAGVKSHRQRLPASVRNRKVDRVSARLFGFGHPVHARDRSVAGDDLAVVENADMRISHEVESRRGGQLDVFVIGQGLDRRECQD